jgi:hypothetical protein
VRVDRPFGDDQPCGDLPVRQALRHEGGDLVFAWRKGQVSRKLRRLYQEGQPERGADAVPAGRLPAGHSPQCGVLSQLGRGLHRYLVDRRLHAREQPSADPLA